MYMNFLREPQGPQNKTTRGTCSDLVFSNHILSGHSGRARSACRKGPTSCDWMCLSALCYVCTTCNQISGNTGKGREAVFGKMGIFF